MIGVVGTAANFIEMLMLWYFDFMGMKIIFSFQIAEDNWIIKAMPLSVRIYFMQRFVQNL